MQALLQLHLSDQQVYCLLRCVYINGLTVCFMNYFCRVKNSRWETKWNLSHPEVIPGAVTPPNAQAIRTLGYVYATTDKR